MKKSLLSCILALTASSSWAVKANPTPVIITQSDGTQLTIIQHGDEHFSWLSTTDGILLTKVGNNFYISDIDNWGNSKASNQLAHNIDNRSAVEQTIVRKQMTMQNKFFATATRRLSEEAKTRAIGTATPSYFPHIGNPRVLVILAQFPDCQFSLPNPIKSFNDYFNYEGHPLPNYSNNEKRNYGSVKQYFKDMSNGAFTPQFDVIGPITVTKASTYYGEDINNGETHDIHIQEFIQDACNEAIAHNTINLNDYDSNNDGYIDLIYVVYAGYSQSSSPGSYGFIWPKSGTVSPFPMGNKQVGRYGVSNELNYYPGYNFTTKTTLTKRMNGIGLFCHEFSHTLGLPDFYPTIASAQLDNQAMEYWDLMDGGEYTDNGYTPTPYTPWEKDQMGWKTLSTITEQKATITLQDDEALKVPTTNEKEYLILHNIQNNGWASKVPGHGMLIYHVNYEYDVKQPGKTSIFDHVNNNPGKPGMTIIPADGSLKTSYNIKTKDDKGIVHGLYTQKEYLMSLYGDPFPGINNINHCIKPMLNYGILDKAFLNISEHSGIITLDYIPAYTSGIQGIVSNLQIPDNRIYTLDGRYVGTDRNALPHGIYIQNRRKFIK